MNKKFFITTLGCKVNKYDSLALKRRLQSAGLVFDENNPDLVVINTCAVTRNAIKKDRRMLNGLKVKFPKAKFVLMGCFPETYPDKMKDFDVDLIWGVGNLGSLVREITKMIDVATDVGTDVGRIIDPPKAGERSRYFLKIQDGCEQFCSYCNIPLARGKLFSRPKQEVIEEVRDVIASGFHEIVLCGIHLGLYGKEKNSKTCDLTQLLREIIEIEGLGRIRLSSIEANDVSDELLDLMKQSEKICKHLHIPLQSGCDKILKVMNRPYGTKYFKQVVDRARRKMPDIAITTDVIVGFPGENENDFRQTKEFVKQCDFSKIHIFSFSEHEKTPAAKMKNKVGYETKKKRAAVLKEIAREMEKKYRESFFGREVAIVIEQEKNGSVKGKEEHYFDMEIPINKKLATGSLYKAIFNG